MTAGDRIKDLADEGGSREIRWLGIGESAGVLADPILQSGHCLGRFADLCGIVFEDKLGPTVGSFVAFNGIAEIKGHAVRIHIQSDVGQLLGKWAEQQAGFL